jgi:hypothetical protein
MTTLARMKGALEEGGLGETLKTVDPLPPTTYFALEKAGEVASDPRTAQRFLSFPGAREISEDPKIIALRNDRSVMEQIAQGRLLDLLQNPRVIEAMNDASLQERIKKFDLKRALDYALER